MKIVIEGANGTGKSTLCEELSSELSLPVVWAGPKPNTDEIAISQCQVLNKIELGLFDRATCISRPIYGDKNEDVHGLSIQHILTMKNFVRLLIKNKTIFIHCVGNGGHTKKDYYTKFHMDLITKNKQAIRRRYLESFKEIPHYEYDFKYHFVKDVLNWIKIQGGST